MLTTARVNQTSQQQNQPKVSTFDRLMSALNNQSQQQQPGLRTGTFRQEAIYSPQQNMERQKAVFNAGLT